jgi:hypothetical protein
MRTVSTASDLLVFAITGIYLLQMRVGLSPDRSRHQSPHCESIIITEAGTQDPGIQGLDGGSSGDISPPENVQNPNPLSETKGDRSDDEAGEVRSGPKVTKTARERTK